MGCGSSKSDGGGAPAPALNIGQPTDMMMGVPRPRFDTEGRRIRVEDFELDRSTIIAALTTMANYIHQRQQSLTIITVGGAVNTLLLQNRQSTHDVDFFGTNLDNDQRILLDKAAREAERRSAQPLGGEWFNNQTVQWLPPNVHKRVTAEALALNEIVFQRSGLKVVAAPWNYAMCGKMNRLARASELHRPYDASDAASYLHYYIERSNSGSVSATQVKQWCQDYQKSTSDAVIRAVNAEYRRLYRSDGIVR